MSDSQPPEVLFARRGAVGAIDLKLAQTAAQSAGAATPLGAEAEQLYALFIARGYAGLDFSGIIRMLRGEL